MAEDAGGPGTPAAPFHGKPSASLNQAKPPERVSVGSMRGASGPQRKTDEVNSNSLQ